MKMEGRLGKSDAKQSGMNAGDARGFHLFRLNQPMGVLQTELVEQLTTGEISDSTETDANSPPSVARQGGQGRY